MSRIDREDLRKLVREALKEALGGAANAPPGATPARSSAPPAGSGQGGFAASLRAALAAGRPARVPVTIGSSADLGRFARDIAEASSHPDLKAAIASGDIGFDLAGGPGAAAKAPATAAADAAYEMKTGVLSETRLVEIARGHRRIVIGADVVLTPLARDKAREMRIELTRQKP